MTEVLDLLLAASLNAEIVLLDPTAPIDERWSRRGWRRQTGGQEVDPRHTASV